MRKIIFCFFVLGYPFFVIAQDAHFSQSFQTPLFLNAALTGLSDGNVRLGGAYRSQWKTINAPFENYQFYFDKNNKNFSYGLLLNQNNAGVAGFSKTNVLLSFSLKKQLSTGENFLSFGAQAGIFQQRFDLSKMTFDSQYNPEKGYDASFENGENFQKTAVVLPDFNVGLNWRFTKEIGLPISGDLGVSFSHINTPRASFLNENIKLPLKTTFYVRSLLKFKSNFGIEPFLMFANQGSSNEFLYGLNAVFLIKNNKLKFGIGNRMDDALIFMTTLMVKNFEFGFSYDVHSQEFESQKAVGSMEFSITYLFGVKNSGVVIPPNEKNNSKVIAEKEESTTIISNDDDEDGIPNDLDHCPFEAGLAKYNGCNDRDNDGVWDNADACPSLPGGLENYGCPLKKENIDSDGDGVKDQFDDCIYLPGPAFLNGCPDSDKDGISDFNDACPYEKGTKSSTGCPDLEAKKIANQLSNDFIEFNTNSSKIQSKYFPFLDRVAFQLKNNPSLKIIIEGHTDNEGNHLYNYHLSQERARFVRNYFYEKGVPLERVELHFFGEAKPKVETTSDFAKARNRRVELLLFKMN